MLPFFMSISDSVDWCTFTVLSVFIFDGKLIVSRKLPKSTVCIFGVPKPLGCSFVNVTTYASLPRTKTESIPSLSYMSLSPQSSACCL